MNPIDQELEFGKQWSSRLIQNCAGGASSISARAGGPRFLELESLKTFMKLAPAEKEVDPNLLVPKQVFAKDQCSKKTSSC